MMKMMMMKMMMMKKNKEREKHLYKRERCSVLKDKAKA